MQNQTPDHEAEASKNLFIAALEETERVAARIDKDFSKVPQLQYLFEILGGFVFYCAQKLIDRKKRVGQPRAVDEAVILACSRLFTECLAGWLLVRRGIILPAATVLRAALETTLQVLMFMENPSKAEQWLKGKQFKPSQAFRTSASGASLYNTLYKKLSDVAHPNVAAVVLHTVPLPKYGSGAEMVFYGGWFAPRTSGIIACQILRLELCFLQSFYSHYEGELAALGLLFRPETIETLNKLGVDAEKLPFGWSVLLEIFEKVLDDAESYFRALPLDHELLSSSIEISEIQA